MEKTCEFCGAPRPIIYCKADGAFLCLSCDSKVHSANALSSRHTRTLLCDSCRYNQASVRCLDHLMLLCKGCDSRIHRVSSQHKKGMINSFSGCPSAKNFAALWGYGDAELDEFSVRGQDGGGSCVSNETSGVISRNIGGSIGRTTSFVSDHETGSSGQRYQEPINNHKEQSNCLIMQQILDLNKLQLTEQNNQSHLRRHHDEPVTPSAVYTLYSTSGNLCGLNQKSQGLDCHLNNLQSLDSSNNATSLCPLDHLSGSSYVGDQFSQNKNPVDPNQLWSQNIQDLGVCEELGYSEVFNIPDWDVMFRNFEDLFTSDMSLTESLLGDDLLWSDIEKETKQDVSDSSSMYVNMRGNPTYNSEKKFRESMKNNHYLMRSSGSPSFSPSRLSAESSSSEFLDSGHSGSFIRSEQLSKMTEGGKPSVRSSKERKKTRMHGKETPLSPRKSKADTRKKIKNRSIKIEGYESEAANVTKRY